MHNHIFQLHWDTTAVNNLELSANKTVADEVALTVGELGENIAVRRAAFLRASDTEHLGYYVHVAGRLDFTLRTLHINMLFFYICSNLLFAADVITNYMMET